MKSIVFFFIKLHYWLSHVGISIRGLGVLQKMLKNEFVFEALERYYLYDPSIEGSYDYLLIGKSNEPETQLFLTNIFSKLETANFIDVGASVGEFVNCASMHQGIQHIYAFEPRPDAANVLRKNAVLNGDNRIRVIENAASNEVSDITIHLNAGGTSSGIYSTSHSNITNSIQVSTVILDNCLPELMQNTVMLIDVEGAEPLVLKGANSFIKKNNPLIVFEYNQTSKQYFHLEEIESILGKNYEIYRLKGDGSLDKDFSNSWNCVAIPSDGPFKTIIFPAR